MVRARISYVCDWHSDNGNDQLGHIRVVTPTGVIEGTWSCTGGMGDGAELISNSTAEFSDDEADTLLNSADLCQGDGTYDADIGTDMHGWPKLSNIVWIDEE